MNLAAIQPNEKDVERLLKVPGVQDMINVVTDIILDICGKDTKIIIHLIPVPGGKLVCTEVYPSPTPDQLEEIDYQINKVMAEGIPSTPLFNLIGDKKYGIHNCL